MKNQFSNVLKLGLSTTAILIAAVQTGCSKKNQNNTVASSFSMTASNKTATVADYKHPHLSVLLPNAFAYNPSSMVDASGLTMFLSKSWVVIKEVEFKSTETAGAGEVDGSEVSFKGPYFVDLLSNAPITLDSGTMSKASFQRIKMKLEKAGGASVPSAAPAALSNNSIYIAGTIGSGGTAVNFIYQSDDGTEYQIGGPQAVAPVDGGKVLVEISFANIFKQINMSTVTNNEVISSANRHSGSNLCPSIDTSALDIYTCIRKGLEKHASVGEDSDNNGTLDTTESKVK